MKTLPVQTFSTKVALISNIYIITYNTETDKKEENRKAECYQNIKHISILWLF